MRLSIRRKIIPRRMLVLALPLLALLLLPLAQRRNTAQAAGLTITYAAGWNLVGGPDGTVFNSSGPTYTLGAGDSNYLQNPGSAPVAGGKGYWANFPADTNVTLNGAGLSSVRVQLPPNQYVMIGNPSGTQSALVGGAADLVETYNATTQRYDLTTTLGIGQGAWALSYGGGTVTITASGPAQALPTDSGATGGLPPPAAAPTSSASATPAPVGGGGTTCTTGPLCQVIALTVGVDGAATTVTSAHSGNLVIDVDTYSFGKPVGGTTIEIWVSLLYGDAKTYPNAIFGPQVISSPHAIASLGIGALRSGFPIYIHAEATLNGATAGTDTTYVSTK